MQSVDDQEELIEMVSTCWT